ncbi:MAG TPA: tyrosine-protein phosphatase [Rhizomicrobium sp.]|jgi:protein-tyrosine phosphatase
MQRTPNATGTPDTTTSVISSERVIPLEGSCNFRDLGGYAAADGRRVRWRYAFRSGSLAGLTRSGQASLAELSIAAVCDFRSTSERSAEPFPLHDNSQINYWCREYETDYTALKARLHGKASTAEDVRRAVIALYRELPWQFSEHYRAMFSMLGAGAVPLIFHCSAGKDRTGLAAALLLSALGVTEGDVIEDYCLSDKVVDYERTIVAPRLAEGRNTAAGYSFLEMLSANAREPLLKSDGAYLQAAFEAINERSGSVQTFLKSELGVGQEHLMRLRDQLLQ